VVDIANVPQDHKGKGGVPLDHYPRELSKSREWRYREIVGGEGFP